MAPEEVELLGDYRTLGLDPGAAPVEVKRAFRMLAKTCHPDRFHSKPYEIRALAEERFKRINQAYGRISRTWVKSSQSGRQTSYGAAAQARRKPLSAAPWRVLWKKLAGGSGGARAMRVLVMVTCVLALLFMGRTDHSPRVVDMRGNHPASPPGTESTAPKPDRQQQEVSDELMPHSDALIPETPAVPQPPASLPESAPETSSSYFTIGSHSSDVLRVQGSPSRIQGQTWVYGLSEIQFRNGLVQRYNNFDGSLKVRMVPRGSVVSAPAYLSIGSTEDDVLRVQGTPTRVEQDKWFYGFSEIKFKDGRICDYNNYFGNLKLRLQPAGESGSQKAYFTIGSSPDEVIAAQGTPTSVQGSVWAYDFAYVFFRDGKVSSVSSSSDSNLRFMSPEDLQDGSSRKPAKDPAP